MAPAPLLLLLLLLFLLLFLLLLRPLTPVLSVPPLHRRLVLFDENMDCCPLYSASLLGATQCTEAGS